MLPTSGESCTVPHLTIHIIMIMIIFQSMESLNRNHVKEKDALNTQLIKLKDELRKAKSERNEMEQTAHDYEKVCLVKLKYNLVYVFMMQ